MRHAVPALVPALMLVVLIGAGCSDDPAAQSTGGTQSAGREQAVEFAGCMRENGVSAFPDPDASGELTADGVANNSSIKTDGPAWAKAIAACKGLEPAGFTGTKRSAAEQATALEFARCIREYGVEDFPDPDPNGPLVDTNRIPSLSGSRADLSELNAAMDKCGEIYADDLGLPK